MIDPVVRLIEESFSNIESSSVDGKMGGILLDLLNKTKLGPDGRVVVISPEIDEKMNFLKYCESKSDLGWMEYSSWNELPSPVKKVFDIALSPLFWTGVFFQYSKFIEFKIQILEELTRGVSIHVLRDFGCYKLVCLSSSWSIYDWASANQFSDVHEMFSSKLVLSIGRSKSGIEFNKGNITNET